MKAIRLLLLAVVLAPGASFAADREFRDVVEALSDAFRARPMRIPLMGLVNAVTFVARPAGTRHIDIAVFEDLDTRGRAGRDIAATIRKAVGGPWKPFLQVRSMRDDSEQNVIVYMRQQGREWKLLLATVERHQATVVQLALNTEALERWMKDPVSSARKRHDFGD